MDSIQRERAERMLGLDPFIKRITQVIPGWLRPGNILSFRHALGHLPSNAPLLEIGSFSGLSTITLLYLKQQFTVKNLLFTCDPWSGSDGQTDVALTESTSLTHGALHDFVRDSFVRNCSYFSPQDLPASFQLTSDAFFEAWNRQEEQTDIFRNTHRLGGTFAFVYVDGSHKHSVVKRDFENIDPLLEPGGFILFDDSEANGTGGPSRVAAHVAALPQYELVHQAPNSFFRKRN